MFVAFLVSLAFAAGCTLAYFLMESPRREAQRQLGRLHRDRADLSEREAEVAGRERAVAAREARAAAAAAAAEQRAGELARETAAFHKRVIAYDELAAENRLLKTDLKNVALQFAHLEYERSADRDALAAAEAARDRLGRAYLDESLAAVRRGLTTANYPASKERVRTAFLRVRDANVGLPPGDEPRALADLHAQYEKAVRAAVEREEQARMRERIREEQRREREAQEAIEQAERERRAIQEAIDRERKAIQEAHHKTLADAAAEHTAKMDTLLAQLAEAEAKSQRAISLAQLTKSGHVYVISNRGSFGPDVFKIGMTRREQPKDRVDELGDASVPFSFDIHMMVKCDDAPKLENALHKRFHKRRLNKVNLRKEFFRASIEELVDAVRELHGEVEYTADAEALEYLQSQRMTDADLAEVEQAFEEAEAAIGVAATGDGDE